MTTPDTTPVILLTFANDRAAGGQYLRNLPEELHQIRTALEPLEDQGLCKVEPRPNITIAQVTNLFLHRFRNRVVIYHFGGHFDSLHLLLETAAGAPAPVYAQHFAALLKQQRGIKLVFLNACSNRDHVQGLHDAGVDAVIATSQDIYDAVATTFAKYFYHALTAGATLRIAFDDAAAATKLEHGDQLRHVKLVEVKGAPSPTDLLPWQLTFRPGAENTAEWKLPDQAATPSNNKEFLWLRVPALPNLERIVGRDELLDDLVARLCTGKSPALSTDGLPGAGKTTLAVLVAHDGSIHQHFVDGVLWAGLGPTPDVVSIQAAWADALGLDVREVTNPHTRQERLSAAVGQRRLLVVIDDAWLLEAARLMRLSGPNVAHLLTTRDAAIARAFAGPQQALKVPVLDNETAWGLLQQLAPEACAIDPTAARALADAVGGLPLALELLGGYLSAPQQAIFPDLSQAALTALQNPARRLELAQERLGNAADGIQTLEAVIQISLDDLGRVDPAAVDAFYALGAFAPKPATFERAAAEGISAASPETLALLAARNLLEIGVDGTLAMHQVLHDAAARKTPASVTMRHRDLYLQMVAQDKEDWQRIEAIYAQIKHAWASTRPPDTDSAVAFVGTLNIYHERRGLWLDKLVWAEAGLALAHAEKRGKAMASMLGHIGGVYSELGDKTKGLEFFNQALLNFRQVGDKGGEATTLTNIGSVYDDLGDKAKALEFYNQALPLMRQVGDKGGEATILNNIGLVYNALGDKAKALEFYNQALPLMRQVGDKGGEATTLNNIGLVYNALGDKAKALEFYNQALPLRRQVGDKGGEATTLTNIGSVYDDLGDKAKALEFYNQALPLRRQVGDKGGEATTLTNIGSVYDDLGDKAKALEFYNQALPLYRQVGDKGGEAVTLNNIGAVYNALGEKTKALEFYNQALPLYRQVGDKGGEATTLNNIGLVYNALGDKAKALEFYNQALPLRRQVGDKGGEATTLTNIGSVYDDLGDKAKALEFYNQALPLYRQVGDKGGEAVTLVNLIKTYLQLGDTASAIEAMQSFSSLYSQFDPRVATALGLDSWAQQIETFLRQDSSDQK